jgi:xylose isomerase
MIMYYVMQKGGLGRGGLNFDAKVRTALNGVPQYTW